MVMELTIIPLESGRSLSGVRSKNSAAATLRPPEHNRTSTFHRGVLGKGWASPLRLLARKEQSAGFPTLGDSARSDNDQ